MATTITYINESLVDEKVVGALRYVLPMLNSFSALASMRSQPGIHALSTAGSFRASQAICCETLSWRLPCISMS